MGGVICVCNINEAYGKPYLISVIHVTSLKPLLGPAFLTFTDLGANFDRLDVHRAVQDKQKRSRKLKVEIITLLLSV